jgi:predicted N-formylglutamate amidohydrolase
LKSAPGEFFSWARIRAVSKQASWLGRDPVALENPQGRGRLMIVCDHASNWVPPTLQSLGLPPHELERHIAWDPGALAVAQNLARLVDAPLVHATVSRLVLDVNRDPGHAGSIVPVSEDTPIPGNVDLPPQERARRVRDIYEPYHRCLEQTIDTLAARDPDLQLVSVHSFTPIYRGHRRPWHAGVLSNRDRRMAQPLLELLRAEPDLSVGDNEPYAPTDGVYHTLDRHCAARGLRSVLLELRADVISDAGSQQRWAQKLGQALQAIS